MSGRSGRCDQRIHFREWSLVMRAEISFVPSHFVFSSSFVVVHSITVLSLFALLFAFTDSAIRLRQ